MSRSAFKWGKPAVCLALAVVLAASWSTGCGGGLGPMEFLGSPFGLAAVDTGGDDPGATTGGQAGGTAFGSDDRRSTDPCSEPQSRKFVTVSMANLSPDYIHYFLVLIADVNGETYPEGAVCPDDIPLYQAFGYMEIPDGVSLEFGNLCIVGPSLVYFHEGGQFQRSGGVTGASYASAIPPALGSSRTYDAFFGSAGAQVPIPNRIVFHNPGAGAGASLKISRNSSAPCDLLVTAGDPECVQDAFYYVDDSDLMAGSTALGTSSGRRVPGEIQGTGCECTGFDIPWQALAPSGVTAASAQCFEFLRGGRIEYVFVREDTNPPYPQMVWKVIDATGAVVHDFDSRANLP